MSSSAEVVMRKGKEPSNAGLPPIAMAFELPPIYEPRTESEATSPTHQTATERDKPYNDQEETPRGERVEELFETVHVLAQHIELMEGLLVKQNVLLNKLVTRVDGLATQVDGLTTRVDDGYDCVTAEVNQVGLSVDKHLALQLIKNVSKTSGNPCSPLIGAEDGAKLVTNIANKYGFPSNWNFSDPFSVKAQHFLCRNLLFGRR
eukprot:jgi/Tetstr1/420298/TSEL_011419.t1